MLSKGPVSFLELLTTSRRLIHLRYRINNRKAYGSTLEAHILSGKSTPTSMFFRIRYNINY